MSPLFFATAFCVLPAVAGAQTYTAFNDLAVIPLSSSSFEVIESDGEGPRGIWCAAASFAQDRAAVPTSTRMYIKTPRGPSVSRAGATGVVFTTDTAELPSPPVRSYSVSVRQQSAGLTVAHASQFCKDYIIELQNP